MAKIRQIICLILLTFIIDVNGQNITTGAARINDYLPIIIDKEIAKLNTKTITTKKEQKYFDRLIYKSNIWKLLK